MKETYCIVDKRVTPCTEPSGYQQDKNGRTPFFCRCAVCGNKKVRYIKMGRMPSPITPLQSGSGKKKLKKESRECQKTNKPV